MDLRVLNDAEQIGFARIVHCTRKAQEDRHMRIFTAVCVVMLASSAAYAQTTPSTSEPPAAAGQKPETDAKQSSPGATGAMQNEVGGVATSPQDVKRQSEAAGPSGKKTTSPGTVGAAPGSDAPVPQPKSK